MTCTVELHTIGPFSPGEKISGKLLCLFDTTEAIEGIKCFLTGEERVNFAEGYMHREYKGSETFLRSEIEITQACTIQAGTYKYPFSFELPADIPSSFEHKNGRVVYEITGQVSRGAGQFYRNNHLIQVSVTVNLNDMVDEITMAPVTYPLEEVVASHCCWYSAHVFLTMTLEKDAFLVGENVKINLNVNNVANVGIGDVVLKLDSHTEVTVQHPQTKKCVTIHEIFRKPKGGLHRSSQKVYTSSINVPEDINVYCFRKCKLIRQWFTITAVIIFDDCYDQIRLPAHIKLGHIPLEGTDPAAQTPEVDDSLDESTERKGMLLYINPWIPGTGTSLPWK